ncbi:acyltransferase family protein [Actinomyces capricornis]|uniref:Acyltransferase n=1 Tax=Actinomyces capricornis TaxID=2755559 RepID=A0ABN6K2Q6_9ACTO|nr:acyltransferase [Actinomyces capricornis]BDA63886.1 acyltransferase [Actinomyces capricornis]
MTPPVQPGRDLPRLTSLRFFAALLIVLFHARLHHFVPQGQFFDVAHMGVAFFFVLSGFVLAWASQGRRVEPRRFWVNRFARVYPSHLVTMLIAVILIPPATWGDLALNTLLLQAWSPHQATALALNAVAWSLSAEAFFYLLAPWLITAARRLPERHLVLAAGAWWLTTIVAGRMLVVVAGTEEWPYYLPLLRSSEFLIGIVLAELFRRGRLRVRPPMWLALLACLGSYLVALAVYRGGVTMQTVPAVITLPAIVLLVVSAAQADVQGRGGLLASPALQHAGRVSFALYLTHYLVLAVLPARLPVPRGALEGLAYLALTLLISWVCAEALHRGVELPAQRAIRAAVGPRRTQPPAAAKAGQPAAPALGEALTQAAGSLPINSEVPPPGENQAPGSAPINSRVPAPGGAQARDTAQA